MKRRSFDYQEVKSLQVQELKRKENQKKQMIERFTQPAFVQLLSDFPIDSLDARTIEILRRDAKYWLQCHNVFLKTIPDKALQEFYKSSLSQLFLETCKFIKLSKSKYDSLLQSHSTQAR